MKTGTEKDYSHGEVGTGYLTMNDGKDYIFVNDIESADQCNTYQTALWVKQSYENHIKKEADCKIVPLKITYEW